MKIILINRQNNHNNKTAYNISTQKTLKGQPGTFITQKEAASPQLYIIIINIIFLVLRRNLNITKYASIITVYMYVYRQQWRQGKTMLLLVFLPMLSVQVR